MKCKFCGSELFSSGSICLNCGALQNENEFDPAPNNDISKLNTEYKSEGTSQQYTKLLIYIALCFVMFIITDFLIFGFMAYMYNTIIIPFYKSNDQIANISSKSIRSQIYFDHVYFYLAGILGAFLQVVLYLIISYYNGLKNQSTKNFNLFFFIIPIIHFLLFLLFLYFNSLNYENMFIVVRILFGGFVIGFLIHLYVRYAIITRTQPNITTGYRYGYYR